MMFTALGRSGNQISAGIFTSRRWTYNGAPMLVSYWIANQCPIPIGGSIFHHHTQGPSAFRRDGGVCPWSDRIFCPRYGASRIGLISVLVAFHWLCFVNAGMASLRVGLDSTPWVRRVAWIERCRNKHASRTPGVMVATCRRWTAWSVSVVCHDVRVPGAASKFYACAS